jgi:hypothetical protein
MSSAVVSDGEGGVSPLVVLDENEETTQHLNEETLREHNEQMEEDSAPEHQPILGGTLETPAFCLLDGVLMAEEQQRVTFPISRLPAILGRTHKTRDTNVIGMGAAKALSREQCRIDYWCHETGRLEQTSQESQEFEYVEDASSKDEMKPPKDDEPFYSITCLGKNRIFVNGARVDQGATMPLPAGAAVKISTFFLYFLLPNKPSTRTMQVKLKKQQQPRAAAPATTNKRKADQSEGGAQKQPQPAAKRARGFSSIQAELDTLSTDELRRQLTAAIEEDIWERRHQLIGSTLSGRAVVAAAQASELREKEKESSGLTRGQVMEWIAASDAFAEWSLQMQTKLETKSYQSSITKAMVKAGFTRTASSGRYIKWFMPPLEEVLVMAQNHGELKKTNTSDEHDDKKDDKKNDGPEESEDGNKSRDQNDDDASSKIRHEDESVSEKKHADEDESVSEKKHANEDESVSEKKHADEDESVSEKKHADEDESVSEKKHADEDESVSEKKHADEGDERGEEEDDDDDDDDESEQKQEQGSKTNVMELDADDDDDESEQKQEHEEGSKANVMGSDADVDVDDDESEHQQEEGSKTNVMGSEDDREEEEPDG